MSMPTDNGRSVTQDELKDGFDRMSLPAPVVRVLHESGYEVPSQLQSACIASFMAGKDLLVHTHTGTGKTLAFVLPLLARLDLGLRQVQAMVLTPNDETSLHVSEVLQAHAKYMTEFHVLPLYHQSSAIQLRQLQRGCHVVVGTPPRITRFIELETLKLDALQTLILDEVDAMLAESLSEDLRRILSLSMHRRQTAIFTASLTREMLFLASENLRDPIKIEDHARAFTVPQCRQRYWRIDGRSKLNALARVIEVERDFDAALLFTHHKHTASMLAEKLKARGYAVAHIDSDTTAAGQRRVAEQIEGRKADILVTTDHSLAPIEVSRFTHLINFDMPCDLESYAHRIEHFGPESSAATVIFLVTSREMEMLHCIEKAIGHAIKSLELPERAR
jgi:ATP-dependent RNA helicase DeaD